MLDLRGAYPENGVSDRQKNMCLRKRAYLTKKAAKEARPKGTHTYICEYCGFYHNGHSTPNKRRNHHVEAAGI